MITLARWLRRVADRLDPPKEQSPAAYYTHGKMYRLQEGTITEIIPPVIEQWCKHIPQHEPQQFVEHLITINRDGG